MRQKVKFKNSSNKKTDFKWIITSIIWTFILSITINSMSSGMMPSLSIIMAFVILIALVLVGIIFDIIGTAVATASDVPFHSMAARKVTGSQEAIALVKNADKVSNFCNDIVGDIVGIISGSAAATIVMRIPSSDTMNTIYSLLLTALVAALTVGGKAFGKSIGMRRSNAIIYRVALIIHLKNIIFKRKKQRS